ncbi:homeodomain-only protein isoform X1 [Scyliorhinus torazame]|uniref:homeodomain-only protein isoform X1 n=1 Tax=Scyliorhinus torazame TaxID=75743 RepID=UPI003B5CFA4D
MYEGRRNPKPFPPFCQQQTSSKLSLSGPSAMEQGGGDNRAGSNLATLDLKDDQIQLLEENFSRMKQPDGSSLMLIAAECGLSEAEAAQWFKQRYAKWRQSEGFPPQCGSVKD